MDGEIRAASAEEPHPQAPPQPPTRTMATLKGRTHFPFPRGIYSVGCADLADESVLMRLFYPHKCHGTHREKLDSLEEASERWAAWYPEPEYAAGYVSFKYSWAGGGGWMSWAAGWLTSLLTSSPACPVVQNGPVAKATGDDGGRFPLVVFSHGNGGCRMTYSTLCAEVASRGFLVAALEHADGSASSARRLEEGRLRWVEPVRVVGDDYGVRNGQVARRAEECWAALRMMERLDRGEDGGVAKLFDEGNAFSLSCLKGRVDLSNGAMLSGHSFGGSTSLKAILRKKGKEEERPRFTSAFCLDAWMFPVKFESRLLAGESDGSVPVFFLNYEKFQWRRNLTTMREFEVRLQEGEEGGLKGKVEESEERRRKEAATSELLCRDVPGNVATIKGAIHYAASDLPTLMAGTWLGTMMSSVNLFGWFSRRKQEEEETAAEDKPLSPKQGLLLSQEFILSFLKSVGHSPSGELSEEEEEEKEVGKKDMSSSCVRDFAECARDYGTYLIWGTRYLGADDAETLTPGDKDVAAAAVAAAAAAAAADGGKGEGRRKAGGDKREAASVAAEKK